MLKLLLHDSAERLGRSLLDCPGQHVPKVVQSYSLGRSRLGLRKKVVPSLRMIPLLVG